MRQEAPYSEITAIPSTDLIEEYLASGRVSVIFDLEQGILIRVKDRPFSRAIDRKPDDGWGPIPILRQRPSLDLWRRYVLNQNVYFDIEEGIFKEEERKAFLTSLTT